MGINAPSAAFLARAKKGGVNFTDTLTIGRMGMAVPEELSSFKFARQKSKLAGTIRGSYFVIKGEY